jgi:hypothetical protein
MRAFCVCVWHGLAIFGIAKHHFFMAQWMALIVLDAMFGARYHVALRGGFMVSNEANVLICKNIFAFRFDFPSMVFQVGNCQGHADRYQAAKPQAKGQAL